jgi:hypothetical protein
MMKEALIPKNGTAERGSYWPRMRKGKWRNGDPRRKDCLYHLICFLTKVSLRKEMIINIPAGLRPSPIRHRARSIRFRL